MMDLWYVVAIALVVVAVILFLRTRRQGVDRVTGAASRNDDYVQGREDTRIAGMSAEDQAWETASQERSAARTRQGQDGPG